jgi:hypothetical protein
MIKNSKQQQQQCILEIYSHVQTPADIKTYRPRVLIGTDPLSQARAVRNHLFDQLQTYCISQYDEDDDNHSTRSSWRALSMNNNKNRT